MGNAKQRQPRALEPDYFRPRDFEYAQPLYDLAYLLEVDALAKNEDAPEYRTFALWKAALSIDGYTGNVSRWLEDTGNDSVLDYEPSQRIRNYLRTIATSGSVSELDELRSPAHERCLRLRAIRSLGVKHIAKALNQGGLTDEWLNSAAQSTSLTKDRLMAIWEGTDESTWEAAHIVPPMLRFLNRIATATPGPGLWCIPKLGNGLDAIKGDLQVGFEIQDNASFKQLCQKAAEEDPFFRIENATGDRAYLRHRLGWRIIVERLNKRNGSGKSLLELAARGDALWSSGKNQCLGDLHTHTNWSDGAAALQEMAEAAKQNGLKYLAVTDHSRSSKLQGGLTPVDWLRQAVSLSLLRPKIGILHGIEVDIHDDGNLDMPAGLLRGMDIVVGSVHSSWADDVADDTHRLLVAIQSGCVDILGHPTSTVLGKPGVPNYYRPPVNLNWERVFQACKKWNVALEFNCFPSRLDLLLPLLKQASEAGCWMSFGSDAHARAHLEHLKIAERVLPMIDAGRVLNLLSLTELKKWLKSARRSRSKSSPELRKPSQMEWSMETPVVDRPPPMVVEVAQHETVPAGSRIVGIDLTASKVKATGVALLDGLKVQTCSLSTDEEILEYVAEKKPGIVSIDSPLGLPGGGQEISRSAGIMRVAEYDLNSVGINAYPALIDSMEALTLRGIRLRRAIEAMPNGPKVIESYPGAAQDILCIPRKQRGLELLRAGLRELGLKGKGLDTESHDEMDAITSAIVGRFFESGVFEPMGIVSEAQLIVPKLRPLVFEKQPIICLAGKTGAGKSVVARYLALFYGFHWLKTRDLIRALLIDDLQLPLKKRVYQKQIKENEIRDADLREFGIIVLEKYHQEPLIRKLDETVSTIDRPVVVDAVRDLSDFQSLLQFQRESLLWFVDTPETMIRNRLQNRGRGGKIPSGNENRIDQKMSFLKANAHSCLQNDTSLEDLRWRVDDELFEAVRLERK